MKFSTFCRVPSQGANLSVTGYHPSVKRTINTSLKNLLCLFLVLLKFLCLPHWGIIWGVFLFCFSLNRRVVSHRQRFQRLGSVCWVISAVSKHLKYRGHVCGSRPIRSFSASLLGSLDCRVMFQMLFLDSPQSPHIFLMFPL